MFSCRSSEEGFVCLKKSEICNFPGWSRVGTRKMGFPRCLLKDFMFGITETILQRRAQKRAEDSPRRGRSRAGAQAARQAGPLPRGFAVQVVAGKHCPGFDDEGETKRVLRSVRGSHGERGSRTALASAASGTSVFSPVKQRGSALSCETLVRKQRVGPSVNPRPALLRSV